MPRWRRIPASMLPNQRLQRTGAWGGRVGWLVSAHEVVHVLCGWRSVARR